MNLGSVKSCRQISFLTGGVCHRCSTGSLNRPFMASTAPGTSTGWVAFFTFLLLAAPEGCFSLVTPVGCCVGGMKGMSVTTTSEFFTGSTGTWKLLARDMASSLVNHSGHLSSMDFRSAWKSIVVLPRFFLGDL